MDDDDGNDDDSHDYDDNDDDDDDADDDEEGKEERSALQSSTLTCKSPSQLEPSWKVAICICICTMMTLMLMLMTIVKLLMMMTTTRSLFASRFPKCGGVAVRIGRRFMATMMLLRARSYHPVISSVLSFFLVIPGHQVSGLLFSWLQQQVKRQR